MKNRIPNPIYIPINSFNGTPPKQIRAYNTIYTFNRKVGDNYEYVIIAMGRRNKKSTPTPPPPSCIAPTITAVAYVANIEGGLPVEVSALDLEINVVSGVSPYLYAIRKDAGVYGANYANPADAKLTFTCADYLDNPNQVVWIRVIDSCSPNPVPAEVESAVLLQNDDDSCSI